MRSVNSQIMHCLSLLQHYRDMQMLSTPEIQACYTAKTNVQSMNITITREFKKSVCIQSKNKTGKFQNFLRCSFWSTRTLASFQFRHFFHNTMQNTNYIVKNIKAFFFSSWECQNISIVFFLKHILQQVWFYEEVNHQWSCILQWKGGLFGFDFFLVEIT